MTSEEQGHSSPAEPDQAPPNAATQDAPASPQGEGEATAAEPTGASADAAAVATEAPTADANGANHTSSAEATASDASEPAPDAPSEDASQASADAPGEDASQASADASSGGTSEAQRAADGAAKKKKKRRRKKKKPGTEGGSMRPATERAPFHVGEEVFGKVTAVLDTAIMVDLSGKALAIFDRLEMEPDDLVPAVSDRFVARVHNDGVRGGLVVLTRKPLRDEEAKPFVEMAAKDGSLIPGLVTGVIKGGVEVDLMGLRAFAPASGMDLHPSQANFAALLGQRMDFKVSQYKSGGRDIVITRRPMLEAEAHERRKHALGLLEQDRVMRGVVRTVVEWGAFVALPDAENLEGLVHITEASHDARARMTDLMKPGDSFDVKITKIDEKGKIWLSRKALIEDPWAEAKQKYASGSRHTGKVVRLEEFGAFVNLEQGVDGLIHIVDLSMTRIEHPNVLLTEGQDIEVIVHNFDTRTKRISLHPVPPPEQADEPPQKISRGAMVQVEVLKHESAGLIVRVLGVTGRSARGFMPAGQTGTQRGTDLRKHFKLGSRLEAKIIDVDPRRGEPKLSIRAMHEDEERRAHKEYRKALAQEGGFGTLGDLLAKKLKS